MKQQLGTDAPSIAPSELDLDTPIWGAANMAPIIGRSVTQTNYLLRTGKLPAKQIGERWVSTRRRLLEAVLGDL